MAQRTRKLYVCSLATFCPSCAQNELDTPPHESFSLAVEVATLKLVPTVHPAHDRSALAVALVCASPAPQKEDMAQGTRELYVCSLAILRPS